MTAASVALGRGLSPDYDRLVDERFGIIVALHRKPNGPDEPRALISYYGVVGNTRYLGEWFGDRISLGTAFYDEEPARRAAIGEAVERYCGNFVPCQLIRASYRDLMHRGEEALDPEALALYSDRQYETPGFPFRRFTRDVEVHWTRGRELPEGNPAWVPASLVYPNFLPSHLGTERQLHFVNLSGLATGRDREGAERSALEEVVERDAITIWWTSGSPCRPLDVEGDPRLTTALLPADLEDPRPLRYQLTEVPNVFGVPVVAALLRDPKDDLVTLGVASRADPYEAALKAIAEAVHLRSYSRELLEPDGRIWRMMEKGVLNRRVYKPYRRDRRYRDDYRRDFRDVVDLGCHAQLYLDPRMRWPLARFDRAGAPRPLAEVLGLAPGGGLRDLLLERLAAEGLRIYSVDVTTPDVAAAGLAVVRVVVTGMIGNAPAAFPLLGGRRLYEDPVRLGLLPAMPQEKDLELAPMPHT
jgi:ribosomal protein S12 methylthiotransferase accessory factor